MKKIRFDYFVKPDLIWHCIMMEASVAYMYIVPLAVHGAHTAISSM